MRQGLLATTLVLIAGAIGGCGGDDSSSTTSSSQPDGASLKAPFDALAAQAYDDAGKDRQADFGPGTVVDGCFIADDEAARAIGEAAGFDLTVDKESYIQGVPDQQERLLCSVDAPAGTDHPAIASVSAGTTTLTPDQVLANLQRTDDSTRELDGTAEGLDPDSVLAVHGGGISQFIWIDGDFTVGLGGLSEKLTPDQGFAALSAAVQGVSRTLSTSG